MMGIVTLGYICDFSSESAEGFLFYLFNLKLIIPSSMVRIFNGNKPLNNCYCLTNFKVFDSESVLTFTR